MYAQRIGPRLDLARFCDPFLLNSLLQSATEASSGEISETVPEVILSSCNGFGFPLPGFAEAASISANRQITLEDGTRLPSWLRYQPSSRSFAADRNASGSLPIRVRVRAGGQQWVSTAMRKSWPIKAIHVAVAATRTADKTLSVERVLTFNGVLSEEQRSRLAEIAERTPVTLTLKSAIAIHTRLG